jgi:hypothetical protein
MGISNPRGRRKFRVVAARRGWVRPWLSALVVEHPARCFMLIVGTPLLTTVTIEWVHRSTIGGWTTYLLTGGSLTLIFVACGAGFIEEFAVSKAGAHMKTRHTAKETIDSTSVSADVSEQLESGETPDVGADEFDNAIRFFAADLALRPILAPDSGALSGCKLHVYLPDKDSDSLKALLEPEHGEAWVPGVGVTGLAWKTETFQLALGTECYDDTYGLDSATQERHKDLSEVAAMPVLDDEGLIMGVLSASNHLPEPKLATDAGRGELVIYAYAVARILIDLLKWQVTEAD